MPKYSRLTLYFVVLAGWLAFAYWLWPDGILDKPLGTATLRELLQALGAVLIAGASLVTYLRQWRR